MAIQACVAPAFKIGLIMALLACDSGSAPRNSQADASQTTARVPDGYIGVPTYVVVMTRDAQGNDLSTGGAVAAVRVTGANVASPVVTDNQDGSYTASYTPTVVGTDQVDITLNGVAIGGSPYTSSVRELPPGNEPLGFTRWTERGFNRCDEDGWSNCSAVEADDDYSIVSDVTAPKSPTNVAQYRFKAGWGGGGPPVPSSSNRNFTGQHDGVYGAMWFRVSDNWQGHATGVLKLIIQWIDNAPKGVISVQGRDREPLFIQFRLQNMDQAAGAENYGPNLTRTAIVRGQWHFLEYVMRSNTPGVENGSIDWWVDGIHNGSYNNIGWVGSGEDNRWEHVKLELIWGGIGDVKQHQDFIWIDHFYVSGGN